MNAERGPKPAFHALRSAAQLNWATTMNMRAIVTVQ